MVGLMCKAILVEAETGRRGGEGRRDGEDGLNGLKRLGRLRVLPFGQLQLDCTCQDQRCCSFLLCRNSGEFTVLVRV